MGGPHNISLVPLQASFLNPSPFSTPILPLKVRVQLISDSGHYLAKGITIAVSNGGGV